MKQITIEFEGSWILEHKYDEELPISVLKNELLKINGVRVEGVSYTAITLTYDEQHTDISGIKRFVLKLFSEKYPEDKIADKVSFISDEAGEKGGLGSSLFKDETKKGEEVISSDADGSAETKTDDKKEESNESELFRNPFESLFGKPKSQESKDGSAFEEIKSLVGALEFKALAKELVDIAEEIKSTKAYDVFTNQCYLFSIGDGCGLTTYLELLARLVTECGLCKMSSHPVREVSLGEYREGPEPFENAVRAIEGGSRGSQKIVCVDVSEWMDKTNNRFFKQFLRTVEKNADENIVVFRVPFVDKDILSRIKYSLSDLLSVKTVSFPPFSQDEIKACAEEELKRHNFTIAKPAWKYFFERISEEKSDGKFYGVNTVKKVVRELLYHKHIANSKKKEKSRQITVSDAKLLCDGVGISGLSATEQLNKLVGVDGVKNRVEEIIAQIVLSLKNNSSDRPCIHMRFVGNPGTGKTTVARIVGKLLKEKGILRVGAFFEYSGRDFCGRYVGETAPKTSGICRDAYGSVLFIDEAYSLYRGDKDSKDYGREAIDTLIAEMENHRNDFVVIMAGYTDDMDKLMEGNLGLKSRMPYTIEFPNFTREQLYEIFVSMVKGKFKYDKGIFDAAHEFFINLPDHTLNSKDFANARFVRNLFERTWAKAAMRCQLSGKAEIVLTRDDFDHASQDKEFANNVPKKTRIGF